MSACEIQCSNHDGHMPYLYEVDSIYDQLLKNGSISTTDYPIFSNEMSQLVSSKNLLSEALGFHFFLTGRFYRKTFTSWNPRKESSRRFAFFITAKYNFENGIWDSGGFEIKQSRWQTKDQMHGLPLFPLLEDRLMIMGNLPFKPLDHSGAISCEENIIFRVRTVWVKGLY